MSTVTVSIVNHNSVEPLDRCIQSLLENNNGIDCKVYVVDNLCEQRAGQMLANKYPEVEVLENSDTLGFGANHNQVLRRALGQYVLVLNPDTILEPHALKEMVQFMNANPLTAVCGPKLVDSTGQTKPPPRRAIDLARDAILLSLYLSNARPELAERLKIVRQRLRVFSKRLFHFILPKQRGECEASESCCDDQPRPCETIVGACMLFRRSAIDQVGVFDERFFLYFEEHDWCVRARRQGWQVCYVPRAVVLHTGGYSTRPQYFRYLKEYVRSALAFYDKHCGWIGWLVICLVVTLVCVLNLARWWASCVLSERRCSDKAAWLSFTRDLLDTVWKTSLSTVKGRFQRSSDNGGV